MNDILSAFSDKTPQSLLMLGSQTQLFPVDVAEICYKADIYLRPFDFGTLAGHDFFQGNPQAARGAIVVCGRRVAILYCANSTVLSRRFEIAYLLAYLCLYAWKEKPAEDKVWAHLDLVENESAEKEKGINLFARKILIPADTLLPLVRSRHQITSGLAYTLSVHFMVSEELMRKRLQDLEISVKD